MAANETKDLIEQAIERTLTELPALRKLKIVFQLELRSRGDMQHYRIELPGPKIEKGLAEGARVILGVNRPDFNQLAEKGNIALWRQAFVAGSAHVAGPPQILKLIESVVERHERRAGVHRQQS